MKPFDKKIFREFTERGLPLCPRCGEDELVIPYNDGKYVCFNGICGWKEGDEMPKNSVSKVFDGDKLTQFSFWIPGDLPTMNRMENEARKNKFGANKLRQQYVSFVRNIIRQDFGAGIRFEKIRLEFMWIRPDKRTEPDNFVAGQKIIIDALKDKKFKRGDIEVIDVGIVPDDRFDNIIPPLIHDWSIGHEHGVMVTVKGVE